MRPPPLPHSVKQAPLVVQLQHTGHCQYRIILKVLSQKVPVYATCSLDASAAACAFNSDLPGRKQLLQLVALAAKYSALFLNKTYGDTLNSFTIADVAIRTLTAVCERQLTLSQEVPAKLAFLSRHKWKLSATEQRCVRTRTEQIARGEMLTVEEAEDLDKLIERCVAYAQASW